MLKFNLEKMNIEIADRINDTLLEINKENLVSKFVIRQAEALYKAGQCLMLTQAKDMFEFSVDDEFNDYKVIIELNGIVQLSCTCRGSEICHHKIASLKQLKDDLLIYENEKLEDGKKFTKSGMIKRVIDERREKARKAEYRFHFSDNMFGEHILYNEKTIEYKLTFRNFEKEIGYCSCPDYQTNKLGTCKHLMFGFDYFKNAPSYFKNKRKQHYPFVEIFLDPLKNYQISWYYPHPLVKPIHDLIKQHFGELKHIEENTIPDFLNFVKKAENYKQILIRPEVLQKIENVFNKKALVEIQKSTKLDFSFLKAELFDYQKQGIEFATFREGAIIADEMGLGKTIQAIAIAILKKNLFGFEKTLIVCPASLKDQWRKEIEKFTNEKAEIVQGFPEERKKQYENWENYFLIVNYETVLRDSVAINNNSPDFIILDEAQRIKNYNTQTASSIKSLNKKHSLVITGTPIENRLIDLYSIANFTDPTFLSPLWEFSYQHCFFDLKLKNKITGYFNLQELKTRMQTILIRREKADVIKELPNISEMDVPVEMHPKQAEYHSGFSSGVAQILSKKIITPFDMQRLILLLNSMRMVCDSTYLIDRETNFSPKLAELEHILLEKIDLKNSDKKIIIFSEWKRMNSIIGKMLRNNNIAFVELNGSVPVNKRGKLIEKFENDQNIKVFISTEAGGVGLNLQVADTVINFELPWNPAKKNQRIGRIDRIGQLNKNLSIINFITKKSIEENIAAGLLLKQNLFDSVLSPNNDIEFVDFSKKGRSQFLDQLKNAVTDIKELESQTEDIEQELPDTEKRDILDVIIEQEELFEAKHDELQESDEMSKEEFQETEIEKIEEIQTEKKPEPKQELEESPEKSEKHSVEETAQELETVMNQGLGFISGLFKMATGKNISTQEQSISVDKKTGEVVMKFKLPV